MEAAKKRSVPPATDAVQTTVGDFGRWQLRLCVLLCLTRIPAAWHQISIVFLAPPADFRCADSGLAETETTKWVGNPCLAHAYNTTRDNGNETVAAVKCESWRYDRSLFTETIVTQWDLVCERQQLATLAQSSLMLGNVFGDVLFGIAADRFGRKGPLLVAVVLLVLSGTATALVPWFEVFLVLRFTTALAVGGTMVTSFVLCMESVGGKWRIIVATLYHIPYGLGYSTMGLIAFYVRDWRVFQLAISLPCVCFIVYFWLISESPRWLVAAGRYDRALQILSVAVKVNKLQEPSGDLVDRLTEMNGVSEGQKKVKHSTAALLRTRRLRIRTLCMCYNWFVGGFCFFGLAQYIGRFGGNIFVNVAVSGLLMTPGKFVCLLTLDRYGRRATLITSLLLAGTGSILVAAAVETGGPEWLKTVCAMCGIMGLSVSVPTVYLYTIELFPTAVRNNGLGFTAMCGRIGSVVAPFAVSLGGVNVYLPPLCFGVVPLVAVLFCLPLPETSHTRLPHSIEDVENEQTESKKCKKGATNQGFTSETTHL